MAYSYHLDISQEKHRRSCLKINGLDDSLSIEAQGYIGRLLASIWTSLIKNIHYCPELEELFSNASTTYHARTWNWVTSARLLSVNWRRIATRDKSRVWRRAQVQAHDAISVTTPRLRTPLSCYTPGSKRLYLLRTAVHAQYNIAGLHLYSSCTALVSVLHCSPNLLRLYRYSKRSMVDVVAFVQSLCSCAAAVCCVFLCLCAQNPSKRAQATAAQQQQAPRTHMLDSSQNDEQQEVAFLQARKQSSGYQCSVTGAVSAHGAARGASGGCCMAQEPPVRIYWDHDNIAVTRATYASILQGLGAGAKVRESLEWFSYVEKFRIFRAVFWVSLGDT